MSLVSLANAQVRKFRAQAGSVRDDASGKPAPGQPPTGTTPPKNTAISTALDTLAKYIPAEIVTLYIAAMPFGTQLRGIGVGEKAVFFIFLLLTPGLLLLAFLGNAKKTVGTLPPANIWPYCKMIASTIAFAVWACAIPGNPWVSSTNAGVASFGALLTSVILGAIGNVIEPAKAEG